jgi:hypothetical protein
MRLVIHKCNGMLKYNSKNANFVELYNSYVTCLSSYVIWPYFIKYKSSLFLVLYSRELYNKNYYCFFYIY